MTQAQASDLKKKRKQQGDPPPICAHPIQALGHSADDYVTFTYYCIECGEEIVHNYKAQLLSSPSPID